MTEDPIPRDFGWRYGLWFLWSNMLTILLTAQAIFLQLTLDSTLSRATIHWLLTGVNCLGIVIAQIKANRPPSPHLLRLYLLFNRRNHEHPESNPVAAEPSLIAILQALKAFNVNIGADPTKWPLTVRGPSRSRWGLCSCSCRL